MTLVATFDACIVVGLADTSFAASRGPNWVRVKPHLTGGSLRLAMDPSFCLYRHWCTAHAGIAAEFARNLLPELYDLKAVELVVQVCKLAPDVEASLDSFGGPKNFDRYILRISLSTRDKVLVSHDGDFWDPKRRSVVGNPKARVAAYLSDQLDVKVRTLPQLLRDLEPSSAVPS